MELLSKYWHTWSESLPDRVNMSYCENQRLECIKWRLGADVFPESLQLSNVFVLFNVGVFFCLCGQKITVANDPRWAFVVVVCSMVPVWRTGASFPDHQAGRVLHQHGNPAVQSCLGVRRGGGEQGEGLEHNREAGLGPQQAAGPRGGPKMRGESEG